MLCVSIVVLLDVDMLAVWVALGLSASGSPTYVPSAIPVGRLECQTLYKIYLKRLMSVTMRLWEVGGVSAFL